LSALIASDLLSPRLNPVESFIASINDWQHYVNAALTTHVGVSGAFANRCRRNSPGAGMGVYPGNISGQCISEQRISV
jgi:hypothetical protein